MAPEFKEPSNRLVVLALVEIPSAEVTVCGAESLFVQVTVEAGTTVTWTNKDSAPHTVTSADGISTSANTTSLFDGSLNSGATFSYTFTKAGTYYYVCSIHKSQAGMHGEIIVQ